MLREVVEGRAEWGELGGRSPEAAIAQAGNTQHGRMSYEARDFLRKRVQGVSIATGYCVHKRCGQSVKGKVGAQRRRGWVGPDGASMHGNGAAIRMTGITCKAPRLRLAVWCRVSELAAWRA